MRKSVRNVLIAAASAALLVQGGGCKRGGTSSDEPQAGLTGKAAGCNVIIISMDTTRADRLGCYGWSHAVTPALDGLARRGVRCRAAFAQAPITLPSHTTLLTGTYPPEHGVRDNGRQALGAELTTLPEVFRKRGYATAAFVAAAVLHGRYGLNRGFDLYDDDLGSVDDERRAQRPAGEVCDRALEWLGANAGRPFMCLIHFFDPHTPYRAPREFIEKTRDLYDAEIAYTDAQIGRIVAWLDERGLRERTLVVVVADHGESLGEHGFAWHSLLVYNATVRIPVLFSLPGRLPEGTTVESRIRMVDIMPTICDLMGWEVPEEVSGESFAVALAGETIPSRPCYGETDHPFTSFGWGKLRFLIDGRWKYIRGPERELYDLVSDPGEINNLAAELPERVEKMEAELAALEARMARREGGEVALSPDDLQALRSLGYVSGTPSPPADGKKLKNPRDMADLVHEFRRAEGLVAQDRAMEAIAILEPLVARSPESFAVVELLAKAYAIAGMLEYAHRAALAALALYPASADTYNLLAWILHGRGALPQAVRACEKALEIDPNHEPTKELLKELNGALQVQRAETEAWSEQIEAAPDAVGPCFTLGIRLIRWGRHAEGLRVLREGLARDPQNARLANALAWHLATIPDDTLRDGEEALRLARMVCEGRLESNPASLDTLAAALAEVGRFDEAVATARRAAKLADQAGNQTLVALLERRLRSYQAKRPIRWLP